jgi:hypothetical protein
MLNAGIEATPAPVEVLEELTPDEERERHRLELKVERAFFEAGVALRALRDKKLYRSTHKTFELYCKDRFGFSRFSAYNKIAAAEVVDNLLSNALQKLPTSERQCLPLAKLEPDEQLSIWSELTKNGQLPSGRVVKAQVNRYKNRNAPPPNISYQEGDVVMVRGMGNPDLRKHDGRWAIVVNVNNYTVTIAVASEEHTVHPQFLEGIDPSYWHDIKEIHQRISALKKCDLDPADDAVLEVLKRRLWFTERQKLLLSRMEQDYTLTSDS